MRASREYDLVWIVLKISSTNAIVSRLQYQARVNLRLTLAQSTSLGNPTYCLLGSLQENQWHSSLALTLGCLRALKL